MTAEPLPQTCPVTGAIARTTTALGHDAWLATGYTQVRTLFSDPGFGRSHPTPETAARDSESLFFGGPTGNFETEPHDQARLRELVVPYFSPRRMRDMRPHIDQLTAGLLDDLEAHGSPADLRALVAVPLPMLVMCELLGVPYVDREQFRAWTEGVADKHDNEKVGAGLAGLFGYFGDLVARKHREPGNDILTHLIERGDVSDNGVATLGLGLLFGGHESTVVEIGLGALNLLRNQDQWQRLVDDPGLVQSGVEELLRVNEAIRIPRYARESAEIDGATVAAGDLVLLDITAANHDPDAFPEPERMDLTRSGATHVTFGYGLRHCVGAPLARVELQSVFGQLATRFPTLRLAVAPEEIRMRTSTFTGGVEELPVMW
ncbi:cytochrome P450 [Nocardia concava]|uniref:cytochrome P450 n=1 Tax=Nocardia concava TaxID=257281 RepID=UPI00031BEA0F|nr:cytochrome P450 [Nocardia concava]